MKHFLFSITLLFFLSNVLAQPIDRNGFSEIDSTVASRGEMKDWPLKEIVDTLIRPGYDAVAIVRALYIWEVTNISFDCHASRHRKQANTSASSALKERMAIGKGYANLFKALCDLAGIHCIVIDGYAKALAESIGNLKEKHRHSWNAVLLNNTWYILDISWSAGYTDYKRKKFTREFTDAWFFTNRELFLLSHYPDNKKWQLYEKPMNKAVFTNAPVIKGSAVIHEVFPKENMRGKIKGKQGGTTPVSFIARSPELIKTVKVKSEYMDSTVSFQVTGNELNFGIPFKKPGIYPLEIWVNTQPAYVFIADVKAVKAKKPAPKKKPVKKPALSADGKTPTKKA